MRAPILVFTGGLRIYRSQDAAERALAPGGVRRLDAFDSTGRPLQLVEGRRRWFGFGRVRAVQLEAAAAGASERRQLRERLGAALIDAGMPQAWADGAPLGALLMEAGRRFGG